MLAFRYGEERGKKFITFTDKTYDSSIDNGCSPREFYIELFTPSGTTTCHSKELDALSEGFLKGSIKKVWRTSDTVYNYLDTGGDAGSFLFVCREDGKTIKINSDFLTEEGYRKMSGNLLTNQ
jgi:hypothetical protein